MRIAIKALVLLACVHLSLALLSDSPIKSKTKTSAELATRLRTENPLATLHAAQLAGAGAAPVQSTNSPPSLLQRMLRVDYVLLLYISFWYLGNYFYNITNKMALKAAGGIDGFPALIATAQLGVGAIYSLYLWAAPDARAAPTVTMKDYVKMIPVAFCMAAAHGASVFSLGAGSVSFAQIVKSCEPAFAAVIGALLYNKAVSKAKWLSLIPVIGGVAIASATELNFSLAALFGACIANCFAAFKGNENKKLMETAGIRERLGTVGNQFAVTNLLAFLISTPIALAKEGSRFPEFLELCKTSSVVWNNMLASGILFYLYNELATMTIKKTSAVTQSVANTAKRAIVILGVAIALGESLSPTKIVGSVICILGVLLYSNADSLFPPKQKSA